MQDSAIVELYAAADPAEAHVLKNLLEQEGIAARVVGDWIQTGLGEIPVGIVTSARIWVPRDNAARANQVLAEFVATHRRGSATDVIPLLAGQWTCPVCGEGSPPDFGICWNCEYDKFHNPSASTSIS